MAETLKRYSDAELEEFRALIEAKIEQAENEFNELRASIVNDSDNGVADTSPTFKALEDGSSMLQRAEAEQLAQRQLQFINKLKAALVRIENKTYGVCRVTGELIPKERLRAVPHTTLSIGAKEKS